jgi:hypothetical protein
VGQIRQPQQRTLGALVVRCTCCGQPLDAGSLTVVLRGVLFDYCDAACRDRHADAVALLPAGCEVCDEDAVGDTGRCPEHLADEAAAGSFPLAS